MIEIITKVGEEWRKVSGRDGKPYFVSNLGRLMGARESILNPAISDRGYLRHGAAGKVHILVCTAFHGPRPEGKETRHLNGNKLDNRSINLCWGTRAENMADVRVHGSLAGERAPKAKLTEALVRELRAAEGSTRKLGRMFGISNHQVSCIKRRVSWAHVE